MKVKTSDFKEAINAVKPALAKQEIIEQSTSFAFLGKEVAAYNDELCIRCPLPKGLKLKGVIKSEELLKLLPKLSKEEFEIDITENEVVMKAGRAKAGFALASEILLPLDEEVAEMGDWEELPATFGTALKFAANTAAKGDSDPKLLCVHIVESGIVEATDNYRMVIWDFGEALGISEAMIRASSAKEIASLMPTHTASGEGWVHFKNEEGVIISCRLIDEQFIDTSRINTGFDGKKITFPKEILEVLDKASVIGQKREDSGVTLAFKNGRILVTSESESTWFKETVPYKGVEGFSFAIQPYLLKDILKDNMECVINKGMLKFSSDQWVYITSTREYTE